MTPEDSDRAAAQALWDADWVVGHAEPNDVLTVFTQHFAAYRETVVAAEREAIIQGLRRRADRFEQYHDRDYRTRALELRAQADAMASKSEWRGESPTPPPNPEASDERRGNP